MECTPAKINIEPENDGSEDHFPFPGVYSQVPCSSSGVYVSYVLLHLKLPEIPGISQDDA